MNWLVGSMLIVAGGAGLLVVLSRDPKRQIFALCANGVVLALLFFVLQAPDVALSEIVVGAVVIPLLFLVTLAAVATGKRG
jgi:uncharacterized MnhB-related membrane protein